MSEASAALAASDFYTAELKAVSAQGMLACLPQTAAKSGFAGGSQGFRHETIDEFLKNVRMLRAAASVKSAQSSGGLQIMPLQFRRAGCSNEY
jgi:hypothetical protein